MPERNSPAKGIYMTHHLPEIGPLQRRGIPAGIYSVCSSHHMVLETALQQASFENNHLLVESTCNQVNQFGGYTGMTPSDFVTHVRNIAVKTSCPNEYLLIGGDHLGPYPWRHENAETAMGKAKKLVSDCVSAGYDKIHLDCGMPLGDDTGDPNRISPELSARRTVSLCRIAENARSDDQKKQGFPLYVIGAEAPTPGGSLKDNATVVITKPEEISEFMDTCRRLFQGSGLENAWQRVVGVVVQPGIDFGADSIVRYDPHPAEKLSRFHQQLPDRMTFEVHATDFQKETALSEMVKHHFALLKCGPVLTFAFREAVFALSHIEDELSRGRKSVTPSDIIAIIDREMTGSRKHWESHTQDNIHERIYRLYGFTDRVRYYWEYPAVNNAFKKLMQNLTLPIPLPLISQYLPEAFHEIVEKNSPATPLFLIRHRILQALNPYLNACRNNF